MAFWHFAWPRVRPDNERGSKGTFLEPPDGGPAGAPPTEPDVLAVDLTPLGAPTARPRRALGFRVPIDQSRTFPVGFFSDRPTAGPIALDVVWPGSRILATDARGRRIDNGAARVTLDRATGRNGEIANVTVTPTAYGLLGLTMFVLRSSLAGSARRHYLPVLLGRD